MSRSRRAFVVGLVAAGAAWTVQRYADERAIRRDPARLLLEHPLSGRRLAVVGADGTRLHAMEFGPQGAPVIVLVHGWTCALRFWTCQIQRLSERFRVIAYDLRGHGRSDKAKRGDYSIEAHAADLDAVIDAAVAERGPALVAGHSLGAMALVAWARDHNVAGDNRIGAAALVNTGMGDLITESFVLRGSTRLARAREAAGRAFLSARVPLPKQPTPISHRVVRHLTLGPQASPAQVEFCERIILDCHRDVRAGCGGSLSELELHEAVASLDVPTVVIAGARDRLTPPVHARRLVKALPNLRSELVIEDAGHMAPVSHPRPITAAIACLAQHAIEDASPASVGMASHKPSSGEGSARRAIT